MGLWNSTLVYVGARSLLEALARRGFHLYLASGTDLKYVRHEAELLGVDIVIPDITYLKQNRHILRGIILTHGHEDHIGALPYILPELNVPVYGTEFTLALVSKRLEEHGLLEQTVMREAHPGKTVEIGPFEI